MLLGNSTALALLFEERAGTIRRAAMNMLRNREDAEDVVGQTFTELAVAMETGRAPDPAGLLGIIAYRRIGHALQARSRRRTFPLSENVEEINDVLPLGRFLDLEIATFRADFDRALRALPLPEREAFALTELRGLTVREASNLLGVHYTTVARRAELARLRIREEL